MVPVILQIGVAGGGLALVVHEMRKPSAKADAAVKAVGHSIATGAAMKALDPGMPSTIAEAVGVAIANEKDVTVLQQFAGALAACGYQNSADAVNAAITQQGGKIHAGSSKAMTPASQSFDLGQAVQSIGSLFGGKK